ncbi:hypothetical protein [Jeotgalibacillus haloalkalitolerans]|uniref:LXG domain-containing protein n=1 Tax=Jeotgalibacillus haloalkalitolerans TaxID=3104292 RepID=A0ABU5KK49_9BACL|nr:hypothetical protein [Jeotgalibacillus sp. HH7-29]MDZ5711639.1 hypothetical protein [Jeotgalibacillus sp. HH7-29]
MQPVIGQSGTIYRSDTLEVITNVDYVYLQIRRIEEWITDFVASFAEAVHEIVSSFVQMLEGIVETNKQIEQDNQIRRTWSVDTDTRLKSQVIENKPRHQVRKII